MKKTLLALLILVFSLSGCGKQAESSRDIVQDTQTPAVTPAPTPVQTAPSGTDSQDMSAHLSELYVMDEGYYANLVAGTGDTLLVADVNSPDYLLLLAHYRISDEGVVEISDKKTLLQGSETQDVYQSEIRAICASPDGYYYVLTGEAKAKTLHYDQASQQYSVAENPQYSGKLRILKYSAQGELLDSVDIQNLPIDDTSLFLADSGGRILIFGLNYIPEEEVRELIQLETVVATSMIVLDFNTGEYDSFRFDSSRIYSACSLGEKALVFASVFEESEEWGLFFLDLHSGRFEKLDWDYSFPRPGYTHFPFCLNSNGDILLNDSEYFGIFDPDTLEFQPLLNAAPENLMALNPNYPDYLDYPAFNTCCRAADRIFIGAPGGNTGPLYVIHPA